MLVEAESRLWGKPQEPLFTPIKRAGKQVWQIIKRGERGEFAIKKFVPLFLSFIEHTIVRPMAPEFPEGFENVFREKMKSKDVVPIVISSHQGHADLITIAVVSKLLTYLANEAKW